MINRTLQKILQARPAELSFLLLLLLTNLLLKVGTEAVDNIAETLFVRRVGVDQLPNLFLLEPIVMVLLLVWFGKLMDRVKRDLFFVAANVSFIVILIITYIFMQQEGSGVYYFFFILQRIFFITTGIVFWLLAADLCDIEQAKRLFAIIIAVGIAGKLLGNLLTGVLVLYLTPEMILLVSGGLFIGCIGTVLWLRQLNIPPSTIRPQPKENKDISFLLPQHLFKLPFVQLFIWLTIVVSLSETLMRFQFNTVLNESLASEQSLVATYSFFKVGAGIFVFLFQALLARRFMRGLGVPGALNIQPVAVVIGFVVISAAPQLFVIAGTVALLSTLHFGFYTVGQKTAVNIFPTDERGRFSAFSKQLVYLGNLLGALILFVIAGQLSLAQLSWLGAIIVGSWFFVLPRLRQKYAEACIAGERLPLDDEGVIQRPPTSIQTVSHTRAFQQTLTHISPSDQQQIALSLEGFKVGDVKTNEWIFHQFSTIDPLSSNALNQALRSPSLSVRRGAKQIIEQSPDNKQQLLLAIENQINDAFKLTLLTAPLRKNSEQTALWEKLYQEKVFACQRASLVLLESLYPSDQIGIIARMLQSTNSQKHSMGVEALENLLQGKIKSKLVKLFASREEKKQAYATQKLGLTPPSDIENALQQLAHYPDSSITFWAWYEIQHRQINLNGHQPNPIYFYQALPTVEAKLLFGASTYPKQKEAMMELAQRINFLRMVEAFAKLSEDELRVVALCLREQNFEASQVIFEEGETGTEFYIIVTGHIELASIAKKQTLQALGPQQTFGDVALFSETPHTLTAVTISSTQILSLERDTLRELLHYYPNAAFGILKGLACQVDRMANILQAQSEGSL